MDPRRPPIILERHELEDLERRRWKWAWYAAIAGVVVGLLVVPAAQLLGDLAAWLFP